MQILLWWWHSSIGGGLQVFSGCFVAFAVVVLMLVSNPSLRKCLRHDSRYHARHLFSEIRQ